MRPKCGRRVNSRRGVRSIDERWNSERVQSGPGFERDCCFLRDFRDVIVGAPSVRLVECALGSWIWTAVSVDALRVWLDVAVRVPVWTVAADAVRVWPRAVPVWNPDDALPAYFPVREWKWPRQREE